MNWKVGKDILTEEAMIEFAVRVSTFGTGSVRGVTAESAAETLRLCGYEVEMDGVIEMGLCEVDHILLQPDRLYIFRVIPGCKTCEALASIASPYKKEK